MTDDTTLTNGQRRNRENPYNHHCPQCNQGMMGANVGRDNWVYCETCKVSYLWGGGDGSWRKDGEIAWKRNRRMLATFRDLTSDDMFGAGYEAGSQQDRDPARVRSLTNAIERITDDSCDQLRQEVSGYFRDLETAAEDLTANNGDMQSIAGVFATLWEMEPFNVQVIPERDSGLPETPGKSLGQVRIVSQDSRLPLVADGYGDTLAEALSHALDHTLARLQSVMTGEPVPKKYRAF